MAGNILTSVHEKCICCGCEIGHCSLSRAESNPRHPSRSNIGDRELHTSACDDGPHTSNCKDARGI